jgi:hypothetical protein
MNEIYNRDLVDKGRILNKKNGWRYCLAILFGMFLSVSSIAQTIQLGSGVSTNSNVPINYNYGYNYTQTIYTAAEMTAAGASATGTITKLRFKPTSAVATTEWKDWVVYIGNTSQASFTSTSNWIPLASLTEVFNGTIVANTVANTWIEITFTSGFAWTGGNIVVAIDENTASFSSANPNWASYTLAPTTGNKSIYYRNDSNNPSPASPGTATNRSNIVAQIQFDGTLQTLCSGTPTGGTALLSPNSGNSGSTFLASTTGTTTGMGITHQWQKFISGAWQDIAGATTTSSSITAETAALGTVTNYRLKVTCTNSAETAYSTEMSFTNSYCIPVGAANNTDEFLNFTLSNLNNTSASLEGVNGYSNYSSTVAAAQLSAGVPYVASLKGGVGTGTHGAAIWIDYDKNGIFENSERVAFIGNTIAASATVSFPSFSVPVSTSVGNYQLRVQYHYNVAGDLLNSCTISSAYAETEDYLVQVLAPPSCLPPTALVSSNIAANTATLNWTASTSSPTNGYDIYYSTTNTAPLEGTTPSANNHTVSPLNVTGLTASTKYYWWVRADCGGSTSTWILGGNFTTACDTATLPYNQGFNTSSMPLCWSQQFVSGTVGFTFPTTGTGTPSPTPQEGTNQVMYNSYSNSTQTRLVSALLSTTGVSSVDVNFRWYNSNNGGATLYLTEGVTLQYSLDGATWTSVGSQILRYNTVNGWVLKTVTLPVEASNQSALYVGFLFQGNGGYDSYLDNVNVVQTPSCLPPNTLASSNVGTTTATFSWTGSTSNPSNGYDVYYSTVNTPPLAGATPSVDNHTASPLNANGLISASTYYWWVRSDCGAETSAWAYGGSFVTACESVSSFSQNWDTVTATALPTCFVKVGTLGSVNTQTSNFSSGPNTLYMYASGTTAEPTLALQPVNNAGAGTHWLKFKLRASFSVGGKLQVGYLTDPADATTFIMLQEFTASSLTYTEFTCSPGTVPSTNNTLALRAKGAPANSMLIDDLVWEAIPSCLAPSTLVSSNIAANTATLSWIASTSSPTNGYDIYYSTTNTAPIASTTPTVDNHTASPLNATGLTAASTYYWWVRSDCGAETSSWATGGSFTTLCNAVNVPYLENFESATVPALPNCTASQNVGTGNNWVSISNPGSGFTSKTLKYGYNSSVANAWFYTQGINLVAGNAYSISYDYGNRSTYAEKMKVAVGTTATNTAMTTELVNYPNIIGSALQSGSTTFTPTVTGVYYFGFNAYSDANMWDLYLDNIKVDFVCGSEWLGTVSTDASNPLNWCGNTIPTSLSNVVVNTTNPLIISSEISMNSITLGISANVTVNGTLNIGNITVASGGMMTVANNAVVLQSPTAVNTGLVTVKRNSSDLFRQDYTLWSSPVSGQNLRNFSPQTLFNRFSSYDTADNGYLQEIVTVADMNTKTFTNAKGYLIRMPNNWVEVASSNPAQPFLGSFTGSLNNSTVSIALSGESSRLNLVGNPYASPISIAAFFAANTNLDQTLYFWRKKASATPGNIASGYATYNNLGFVSADTDINGVVPTNIQTGQGFFVVANSAAPGNLVFNNTMRNNGAATFYKGATETNELHRLWLNLSSANEVIGQALIGYKTNATQGVDAGVDALYFNDSPTALTSLINNTEYIIQGRSVPFVNTDIVPLGFKSNVAGSYTIALANFDGLFAENQDIFLKDNVMGSLNNLKVADYTFTTTVGIFNERFEIHYANTTLGTNNPVVAANTILIGVKDQQITINAGTVTMDKVELIDVAGRVIYMQDGVNATTATLENVVSANQMLIVRISTKENGIVTQKIIF